MYKMHTVYTVENVLFADILQFIWTMHNIPSTGIWKSYCDIISSLKDIAIIDIAYVVSTSTYF